MNFKWIFFPTSWYSYTYPIKCFDIDTKNKLEYAQGDASKELMYNFFLPSILKTRWRALWAFNIVASRYTDAPLYGPLLVLRIYILRFISSSWPVSSFEQLLFSVEVISYLLLFAKYRRRMKIMHFTEFFVGISGKYDTAKTIIIYICIDLSFGIYFT